MKILIAQTVPFDKLTGCTMYVYELSKELSRLGHSVVIKAPSCNHFFNVKLRKNRVEFQKLRKICKNNKFDIIILNQSNRTLFLLDMYPNTPAMSIVHSFVYSEADAPCLDKRILSTIFIREDVAEYYKTIMNISLDYSFIVYNGIDFSRFNKCGPDQTKPFILFVATLNSIREAVLLDIAEKAKEREMEVCVVGDVLIPTEHIPTNVKFYPPTWDIEVVTKECTETVGIFMGRSTIEGWACGKPGWIYDIDKEGNIIDCKKVEPPENIEQFDIKYMTQRLLSIIERK